MLDIGATEILMIVIVAVVVIGPKDMPLAMRTAGRWIGKMRKVTGHFRAGIDAMVREAELEEMEQKWRAQNEAIMNAAPKLPTADEMQAPAKTKTPAEKANNIGADSNAQAGAEVAAEVSAPAPDNGASPLQPELNLAPETDPARTAS